MVLILSGSTDFENVSNWKNATPDYNIGTQTIAMKFNAEKFA